MFRDKYRTYINWGLTAAAVIAVCTAVFFFFYRFSGIVQTFNSIARVLSPFSWGIVIAFILDSLVVAISRVLDILPLGRRPATDWRQKVTRIIAIVLSELIFIALITVLIQSIVPQVIDSLRTLVNNFDRYAENLDKWSARLVADYPAIEPYYESAKESLSGVEDIIERFIRNDLLRVATNGLVGAGTYLYNFIIGLIVSIYMLLSKRHLIGMMKKLLFTVAKPAHANLALKEARHTIQVFKGYLVGKLLDSLIIGVLCFIGTKVLGIPFALLISIIVGVTNIIPSFGPIIGAVPSAFLVLIVDPMKCLIFVIFIIVLQQLDGNVIGPKILGNSTGVSSLGVLFSIVVGGGLIGVTGMIMSVPSYAVIYSLIKRLSELRLRKAGLPTQTTDYITLDTVNPETLRVAQLPSRPGKSSGEKKKK